MPRTLYTTTGGFYPTISPSGRYVLAGNGVLKLIDLQTKTERLIAATLPGFLRGGWYSDDEILIQHDDGAVKGDGFLYRYVVTDDEDSVDTLSPFRTDGNYRGGEFRVSRGHWAVASGRGLIIDGRSHDASGHPFGVPYYSMDLSDDLCGANYGDPSRVRIIDVRTYEVVDVVPEVGPNVVRASGRYVGYGFNGPSWLVLQDGTPVQVNLAPQESPGLVLRDPVGMPYVLTQADLGTTSALWLRPLGHTARTAIQFISGGVRPDVRVVGDRVLVAADLTNGKLTVLEASFSEALTALPVTVEPFAEPILTILFFGRQSRYGIDLTAPGACQVVVDAGIQTTGRIIIARVADKTGADLIAAHKAPTDWARVDAIYVAEEVAPVTMAKYEAAIAAARKRMDDLGLPRRPILTYTGPRPWAGLSADWYGVQCYIEPGETVEQADARWRTLLQMYAGKEVVIIGGASDRGGTVDAATLAASQARLIALARGRKGLAWFAWLRPGGAAAYPGVAAWIRAACAVAKAPAIETIGAPIELKPRVTISGYGPKVGIHPLKVRAVAALSGGPAKQLLWRYRRAGASTWTTAAKNPATDDDHHFRFETAGTYEIGVDVTGLDDKIADGTRTPRVVKVA